MNNDTFDRETLDCAQRAANITDIATDPWEYITCFRGPQTQDLDIAIAVTVINSIIFVTGLLGNIIVCVVIFKHQALNSPTDYYLLNLAISDVTLLIFGLPYDIMLYWYQYPWILGEKTCQARALFSEAASYASVLTVVTFSTERYLAICHPLYKLAISSLQRAVRIIVCLWIMSFIFALPFALYSGVHYIPYPTNSTTNFLQESAFCAMISQPENVPLTELSSIIFFIIPMIIILYQYVQMGLVISRTTSGNLMRGLGGSVHGRSRKNQANVNNIVKMLAFVVLGFFACWCPFHAQRLASTYLREYSFFDELNYWMYISSGILYYFSSTLNPILYNVMSERMRNAFKEVICGVRVQRRSTYSRNTIRETSEVLISNHASNTIDNDDILQLGKDGAMMVYTQKSKSNIIKNIVSYDNSIPYNCGETTI